MNRPFEKVLGNTCEMRLLEFLLPLSDMEFNITELAEETGVSRVTVGRVVKKFVTWEILNRSTGKIPMYSINPESPIVKSIEILNNSIIELMLGEERTQEIWDYIREQNNRSMKPQGTLTNDVESRNNQVWPIGSIELGEGDYCFNPDPKLQSESPAIATGDYSFATEHQGYV